MTNETSNTILVICAICGIALQLWTAQKPFETKILILVWFAELSCAAAMIAAVYFLITTDKIRLPFAFAFYNFIVQGALFAMSPRPAAARKEILSIIFTAVFVAKRFIFSRDRSAPSHFR